MDLPIFLKYPCCGCCVRCGSVYVMATVNSLPWGCHIFYQWQYHWIGLHDSLDERGRSNGAHQEFSDGALVLQETLNCLNAGSSSEKKNDRLLVLRHYRSAFLVDALHIRVLGKESARSLIERTWTSERPNEKQGHEKNVPTMPLKSAIDHWPMILAWMWAGSFSLKLGKSTLSWSITR